MNFDQLPKKDGNREGTKKSEGTLELDLSPEEMELFELQRQHLNKLDSNSLPAFDSKTGLLGVLKMSAKNLGEILSPRGIRLMLNDAKLNKINAKYAKSKEGSVKNETKNQGVLEVMTLEEEISGAQENLKKLQEKLLEVVERVNKLGN